MRKQPGSSGEAVLSFTLNSPGHFSLSRGLPKGHPREGVGGLWVTDWDTRGIAGVIFTWSHF